MKTIHELQDEYRNFSDYDPSPTVISDNTTVPNSLLMKDIEHLANLIRESRFEPDKVLVLTERLLNRVIGISA